MNFRKLIIGIISLVLIGFNIIILFEYERIKKMNFSLNQQLILKIQENVELNESLSIFMNNTDIEIFNTELISGEIYLFVLPESCFSCLEKTLMQIKMDRSKKIIIISSGWNAKKINDWIKLNGKNYFSLLDSEELVLSLPKLITSNSPCFFKLHENKIKLIHRHRCRL